jgi:hypothetical protein
LLQWCWGLTYLLFPSRQRTTNLSYNTLAYVFAAMRTLGHQAKNAFLNASRYCLVLRVAAPVSYTGRERATDEFGNDLQQMRSEELVPIVARAHRASVHSPVSKPTLTTLDICLTKTNLA